MADPADRLCPECGEPATARWPVAVSLWPKRRMIPALVALLAAAALGVWLWKTSTTNMVTSGTMMPRALEPRATLDQLERIAAGEDAAGDLAAALRAAATPLPQPGVTGLDVGWVAPPGDVITSFSRGWPSPWLTRHERRLYADSSSRTGFIPSATDASKDPISVWEAPGDLRRIAPRQRLAWSGAQLYRRPPPEETGGVYVTETYNILAAFWPIGAAVTVWIIGSAAILIARLVRRRREGPVVRRALLLATGAAAVAMLGLLLIPSRQKESVGPVWVPTVAVPGQPYRLLEGFARLPATLESLSAPAAPDDAALARMILDSTPPPDDDRFCLAVAGTPEAVLARASTRTVTPAVRLLTIRTCQYERRSDFGPVEPLPGRFRIFTSGYGDRRIVVRWASGPNRANVTEASVNVSVALAVIIALWLVWLIARLGATASLAITARRRRRGGQCVACGYG